MREKFIVIVGLLSGLLVGCGSNGGGGGGGGGGPTTLASLSIAAGASHVAESGDLTVTGDVTINGVLQLPASGKLVLHVGGNLLCNGAIRTPAGFVAPSAAASNLPLSSQPAGLFIIVAGNATFGAASSVQVAGPVVVTDNANDLNQSEDDVAAEVDSTSGTLPTVTPTTLPDGRELIASVPAPPQPLPAKTKQAAPVINIAGNWNLGGLPGDRPVTVFRFNVPNVTLNLNAWTFTPPPGARGVNTDNSAGGNQGSNATGGSGKRGMNLNIWNNQGPITITGVVTLNMAPGGKGGDASAVCATATGGPGGKAGNTRLTGAGGVDVSNGRLVIVPGVGGAGGDATVTARPGAAGCPGVAGCATTAVGGKGSDEKKALTARGNVTGAANIQIGPVVGGAGGLATATGGDGGPGNDCCDGGAGGKATATGGAGGNASINLSGTGATAAGATGGAGGTGNATGGKGGKGGDCKFGAGGKGGKGGDGKATGGAGGGGAASAGAGTGTGGAGGDANGTGGKGGNGGSSAITPGAGGKGGKGDTTGGAAGTGPTPGASGNPHPVDGTDGSAGSLTPIRVVFCVDFGFLANGAVSAGDKNAPLMNAAGTQQVGTMTFTLAAIPGAQYFKQSTPAAHIGLQGPARMDLKLNTANPPAEGQVVGLRLAGVFANGLSANSPITLRARNSAGATLSTKTISQLPLNPVATTNKQSVDVKFDAAAAAAVTYSIDVPTGVFVGFLPICILDP